jgi:hypothetical protein
MYSSGDAMINITVLDTELDSRLSDECNHDLSEQETACADGFCPICATAEIVRLTKLQDELAEARDSKNDSGPIRSFRKALSDFVVRLEVAKSKSFNLRNGQMLINPHANTDPHNQYVNWVNEVLGNWQKNCENNEFEW